MLLIQVLGIFRFLLSKNFCVRFVVSRFSFGGFALVDSFFPHVEGLSESEAEKLYFDYAKSFGDCEAPKDVSAHHGFWELMWATSSYNFLLWYLAEI